MVTFLASVNTLIAQLIWLIIPRISGWSMISYFLFLFYGFIFASNDKYKTAIQKNAIPALFIGVFVGLIALPLYLGLRLNTQEIILLMVYGWSMMILIFDNHYQRW